MQAGYEKVCRDFLKYAKSVDESFEEGKTPERELWSEENVLGFLSKLRRDQACF